MSSRQLMTPERWRQVRAVFDGALERPASERDAFLAATCGGDTPLRDEVLSLLRAHDEAGPLLDPPLPAGHDDEPPEVVGPYRLIHPLGRGGMGTVYLARRADDAFQKQVAVKVLNRGMDTDEVVRRFRAERQILASLEHPGIARLLDGGSTPDGRPYLVMEYVHGTRLDHHCDERRLGVAARLELVRRVCSAVHVAHQSLVVHRDLKPGNILVTAAGDPKLLDFGIAKLLAPTAGDEAVPTRTGFRPMTPEYASPEQVRGAPITTASDVYSLGVILYELLTGRRPDLDRARGGDRAVPAGPRPPSAVVDGRLRRALAGDLDTIVLRALDPDPRRRYASAEQLAEDLEHHLKGRPVLARRDTSVYRLRKFVGRHRAPVAAAALALVLGITFTVTLLVQRRELIRQRNSASAVSRFLVDLFAIPDPTRARGETVTARQLLDRGAAQVRADLREQPAVLGDMLDTMGRTYKNLGLYPEARALLEEALAVRRRDRVPETLEVASTLQHLADVLTFDGDYDRAEPVNREALALRRRLTGDESPETAESQMRLARLLGLRGRYEDAEAQFRGALRAARRSADPEILAAVLDRFAILLAERGRDDEAGSMFHEALALLRGRHGDTHPEVALTLNNLALLEQRRSLDAAETGFREAEALQRRLFTGPHPQLATTLGNLGLLLQERGRYQEAEAAYREALTMQRAVYGAHHPMTATTLGNLAGLRHAQGRSQEAEVTYREALAVFERVLGEAHPDTANAWNNLGRVLAATGRTAEAESLLRRALEVTRRRLGPSHRRTASMLNNLADVTQTRGDLAAAESLYREALAAMRSALGAEHSEVAIALHNLATLERQKGDATGAEATAAEAVRIARRRLGDDHPVVAQMELTLASLRNQLDRPVEAEAAARHARDVLARTRRAEDALVLAAERILAASLTRQRRYSEAETVLLAVLKKVEASSGPGAPATVKAAERVASLYDEWGRPAEAAAYRRRPRR